MRLSAAAESTVGPRPINQDASFFDLELGLVVIADGMGGHNAGEVASRMAVEAVVAFVRETRHGGDLTWPFPYDPSRSPGTNRVLMALRMANRQVHDAGRRQAGHAGMGTTLVVGLIDGDRLNLGHVGDSRAYRLDGARFEQMTTDHTWLNALVAAGGAAAADAHHPMRHVLTNGIGMRADLTPTTAEATLTPGSRWLFCTDGVHGHVDAAQLARSLAAPSAAAAATRVLTAARDAGTSDNATALVLFVD